MKITLDAIDLEFLGRTKKIALNMVKKGYTLKDIAECTEEDIETVKEWINENKEY